jgi:hypothetical protein
MHGFLSGRLDVADYRRFLEGELCWFDGAPTHRSSGPQRQCRICRAKWNFLGRRKHLNLLLEYCKESKAGEAGQKSGCSRNTAQAAFRDFDRKVKALVQKMHREGGFAVVTEETTLRDLERLRIHPGKRTPAEAVSRALFFHGFDIEDRIRHLLDQDLESVAKICLKKMGKGRQMPPVEKFLLARRHLTDLEWGAYLASS